MKNMVLVLWTIVAALQANAQQTGCACPDDDDYGNRLQIGLMGFEYNNPVEGYKGKQFFNNWTLGEVFLLGGDIIRNIYLQYDQYQDLLLWLRKSDFKAGILNKDAVTGFLLYDNRNAVSAIFAKKRIAVPYLGMSDVFLEVLEPGDVTLYAYRSSSVMSGDNRLVEYSRYLVSVSGSDYWIRLQRKNLLGIPGVSSAEMKDILRTNKITVNGSEEGFIRAISLYNAAHQTAQPAAE